jgi:hypothetical protein
MKKKTTAKPTASKFSLLRQLCNFIPPHLVPRLARATGVDEQARTFSPWSHVVSLLYAQITHSLGLNDVCDALRLHSGPLSALRGAMPTARAIQKWPSNSSGPCWISCTPCSPPSAASARRASPSASNG